MGMRSNASVSKSTKLAKQLQAFDIIWIGGRTGLYRHPDAIFSLVPKFEADVPAHLRRQQPDCQRLCSTNLPTNDMHAPDVK